jgi:hypothetical protein
MQVDVWSWNVCQTMTIMTCNCSVISQGGDTAIQVTLPLGGACIVAAASSNHLKER